MFQINFAKTGTTRYVCGSCAGTMEIINSVISDDFVPRCRNCNHIEMRIVEPVHQKHGV